MRYFDYQKVAREAGISSDDLAELAALIRQEFPSDDMMYELHLARACMAVRDGRATLDEVLDTALAQAA